jgi:hypothetical protein
MVPQQPQPPKVSPEQPPPPPKISPPQTPPKGAQLVKDAQDQLLQPKGGALTVSGKDVREAINSWIKGEQGNAAKLGGGATDPSKQPSGGGPADLMKQGFIGLADPRVDQVTFRSGQQEGQVAISVKASMAERLSKAGDAMDEYLKSQKSLEESVGKALSGVFSSDRIPLDARGMISIDSSGHLQARIESVPDRGPLTDRSKATSLANDGLKALNKQLDAKGLKVDSLTVKDGKLSITTKPK